MTSGPVLLGTAPEPATRDGVRQYPTLRPRDAASLILVDRTGGDRRVLVGKRGKAHAFMPDLYVFPGGRRDAADARVTPAAPLDERVTERLTTRTPARFTAATAHGLAIAAARELEEEVALSLTPPAFAGLFRPDLSRLRYVARAITPPGQSRRFDTRFFVGFTDELEIDPSAARESPELHDLTWMAMHDGEAVALPRITRIILKELETALAEDADLAFGRPVPFYYTNRGRYAREVI